MALDFAGKNLRCAIRVERWLNPAKTSAATPKDQSWVPGGSHDGREEVTLTFTCAPWHVYTCKHTHTIIIVSWSITMAF